MNKYFKISLLCTVHMIYSKQFLVSLDFHSYFCSPASHFFLHFLSKINVYRCITLYQVMSMCITKMSNLIENNNSKLLPQSDCIYDIELKTLCEVRHWGEWRKQQAFYFKSQHFWRKFLKLSDCIFIVLKTAFVSKTKKEQSKWTREKKLSLQKEKSVESFAFQQ